MTPLTRSRRFLASSAWLLLVSPPLLAQTPAGAPASAPTSAQAQPQAAPEPPLAASATPGAWQGLRYGAGYQARQSLHATPTHRAPQAPAPRRGRGRW